MNTRLTNLVKEHVGALLEDDDVDEVKLIVVSAGSKIASWQHREGVEKVLSRNAS